MKATVIVVLLGLSSALAADKEKKTNKRGTLEESLGYGGYGLGAPSFDLNKSFGSSLGHDIVAIDSVEPNRNIHPPISQIPETIDLGATVSRHTTITKNFGISVPQHVPVAVQRTVQVALPHSVQITAPQVPVSQAVQVQVPEAVQIPVPQAVQVQVPQAVQVQVPQALQVPLTHAVQVPLQQAFEVPASHAVQVPQSVQVPVENSVQIAQQIPVHIQRTVVPVQRPLVVSLYNVPLVQSYSAPGKVAAPASVVSSGLPAQVYANPIPFGATNSVKVAAPEHIPAPLFTSPPVTYSAGSLSHNFGSPALLNAHTAPTVASFPAARHSFGPHAQLNAGLYSGSVSSKNSYFKL